MRVKIADKQAFLVKVEDLIKQIDDRRAKDIAETKEFYSKKRSSFFGGSFNYDLEELFLTQSYAGDQYKQLLSLKNALQSNLVEEVWLNERQIGWFL